MAFYDPIEIWQMSEKQRMGIRAQLEKADLDNDEEVDMLFELFKTLEICRDGIMAKSRKQVLLDILQECREG